MTSSHYEPVSGFKVAGFRFSQRETRFLEENGFLSCRTSLVLSATASAAAKLSGQVLGTQVNHRPATMGRGRRPCGPAPPLAVHPPPAAAGCERQTLAGKDDHSTNSASCANCPLSAIIPASFSTVRCGSRRRPECPALPWIQPWRTRPLARRIPGRRPTDRPGASAPPQHQLPGSLIDQPRSTHLIRRSRTPATSAAIGGPPDDANTALSPGQTQALPVRGGIIAQAQV